MNTNNNKFIIQHLEKCLHDNVFEHIILYGANYYDQSYIVDNFIQRYYDDTVDIQQYVFYFDLIHDRGIKKIRKELRDFCIRKSIDLKYFKFVIIPKAEYLNHDSLCALRRIIELYSLNIRFIFICNSINSIIPAIISRCIVFRTDATDITKKDLVLNKMNISSTQKLMFQMGITATEYKYIISLCDDKKSANFVLRNFEKIKSKYSFSNEILLNVLYDILRNRKDFEKITLLSEVLYLNYQLPEHSDIVLLNILNILNLIKK